MNAETRQFIEGPFNKGIDLWRSGRYDESLKILLKLATRFPDHPPLLGVIASVYFEMDDLEHAIEYFKRTVELSPKSELASRGLFHSLYRSGFKDRAFSEIRRFLSLRSSDEYLRLLSELNEELFLSPGYYLKISDNNKTSRN